MKLKHKKPPVQLGQIVYVLEYSPLRIVEVKVIEVNNKSFRVDVPIVLDMIKLADDSWYTFKELSWNKWIFTNKNTAKKELERCAANIEPKIKDEEKIYSVIVIQNPETDGLALFMRKTNEISRNDLPMLEWDNLTWGEAIEKCKFLRRCLS